MYVFVQLRRQIHRLHICQAPRAQVTDARCQAARCQHYVPPWLTMVRPLAWLGGKQAERKVRARAPLSQPQTQRMGINAQDLDSAKEN